ncbi:MAG: hypothetical protein DRI73_02045 [Bacteroidetes bacterium]|nr:MAG: hypothetical protein DRI73_02045 [Bacteroidota bacterium]
MKKKLILLVFVFVSLSALAQNSKELKEAFKDGEYFLAYNEYTDALPFYKKIYDENPENANINYKIGLCYLNIEGQKDQAIPYLLKAVSHVSNDYTEGSLKEVNAPTDAYFFLGNAYQIQNNLVDAENNYETYLGYLDPTDTVNINFVNQNILSCQYAKEIVENRVYFESENIGNQINTPANDFDAVISGDGTTLVYVSVQKFYDALFYSKKNAEGNWGFPVNITPDIKSDGDLYPTGLSNNGETLLLVRDDNFNSDIYISEIKDGQWTPAKKLEKPINTKFWESHASLSKDGKTMYFTSNRTGGFGGLDIYKTTMQADNTWGSAVNLGSTVNSQFNEETPFITGDNNTLFFASQGHRTMGGFDIFSTESGVNEVWSEPMNVGYPINSTDDDMFFIPSNNGISGYMSFANGNPNFGKKDIYLLNIFSDKNPRTVEIKGNVFLAGAQGSNNARVTIRGGSGDSPIVQSTNTRNGSFTLTSNVPGTYTIEIESDGYVSQNKSFNLPANYSLSEVVLNSELSSIEPEKIILKNVYFGFASSKITGNEADKLNHIVNILNNNVNFDIEVAGYTDPLGPASYNKVLSEKRAKAISDYLIKKGIKADRIIIKGYGETNFIAINKKKDGSDEPEGRKYNRRVEFHITSGDKIFIIESEVPASLKTK